MNVEFLMEAEEEFAAAALFYEEQQEFLGERFLAAVQDTLARIVEFPQMFHEIELGIRQARVLRFPYAVVYTVSQGSIQVVAVAHLRRAPGFWKSRKGS